MAQVVWRYSIWLLSRKTAFASQWWTSQLLIFIFALSFSSAELLSPGSVWHPSVCPLVRLLTWAQISTTWAIIFLFYQWTPQVNTLTQFFSFSKYHFPNWFCRPKFNFTCIPMGNSMSNISVVLYDRINSALVNDHLDNTICDILTIWSWPHFQGHSSYYCNLKLKLFWWHLLS